MAFGARVAGVVPLVGAVAGAMALAGVAVFTVSGAGCGGPGEYVQRGTEVELVGGCVDVAELPVAPGTGQEPAAVPGSAVDRLRQVTP